MPFPGSITPLLRFDGTQPAFQDIAQTIGAIVAGDPVRSIRQPAPLSGAWTTAGSDANPPSYVDGTTLAFEPLALDYPTHNCQYLTAPAASIPVNSCTVAIAFRPFATYGATQQGLLSYGNQWGFNMGGNAITVQYNGGAGSWDCGARLGSVGGSLDGDNGSGRLVIAVATYFSTKIDLYIEEDGVVLFDGTLTTSVTSGTLSGPLIGSSGTTAYGNMLAGQGVVVASSLSPTDRASLITFLRASGVAPAFPTDRPLVELIGDSIANGSGTVRPASWAYRSLAKLRPAYPTLRMLNAAIVGSGVVPTTGPNSTQYKTVSAHFSTLRSRTILVHAAGTNEIIGDPSDAGVDAKLAILYATCDAARAAGALTVVANLLDRSGLMGTTTKPQYDHGRARWNASLDANVGVRFDRLADCRTVAELSDSTNLTYFVDGVHPTTLGHSLLEPVYTAAIRDLAAGDAPAAVGPGISSTLSYDQTPWHRPGVDELGGGAQRNVTKPRDPRTVPDARTFNQLVRQIVAQATLAPSVRLQVEFPSGAPTVTAVVALNSSLVPGDFTITDNGNGDTSLTLAKYVGEQLRPLELTVVGDVEIDRMRVIPIAGGWRVKTKLGATGTDAPFVLALHAPAQH